MEYLLKLRNKYYHLNYFTISQLTFLCEELARCKSQDFPDQVFQLLGNLTPDVSTDLIRGCIEKTADTISNNEYSEAIHIIPGNFFSSS